MLRFEATQYGESVGFQVPEYLGFLPEFLSESDPRPAAEQIDENYAHGGGWDNFQGFRYNPDNHNLTYPGDAPLKALASAQLRDERLYFYEGEWLAIVQPDGSFETGRMD